MLVHFDPTNVFREMVVGNKRYDQEIMDFIRDNDYRYFDMNKVHLDDFKNSILVWMNIWRGILLVIIPLQGITFCLFH